MGIIKSYILKLEHASNNLENVAIQSVKSNEAYILSVLKENQLSVGLDGFGQIVGTYKASTINNWMPKDPPRTSKSVGQPYNFEWHGRFKDTMKIQTNKEGFVINSVTKRSLEAIFNTNLTKLTKENMEFVVKKIIEPALYKSIFDSLAFK
jgi:hypothetical protein